jgi:hypothetical protein
MQTMNTNFLNYILTIILLNNIQFQKSMKHLKKNIQEDLSYV